MKIKREILGTEVEIELTYAELREAYNEERHNCDMEDIRTRWENINGGCIDEYDEPFMKLDIMAKDIQKYMDNDELVSEMADRLRKSLDNNDCISECLWNAAEDVIKEVIGEEMKKASPPAPKEVVRIQCYGDDDYDAYFVEQDCSVRGTFKQIMAELKEGF